MMLRLLGFILLTIPAISLALPFNDDMVDNQISVGQITRPEPKNSIPIGSLKDKVKDKAEAGKLENPIAADEYSIFRGKRLFKVHCAACHGQIGKQHVPAVAGTYMGAPNLANSLYHDRSEGSIYGTILFGSAIMPALGWKLTPEETWDIVNYIKSIQNESR